jgi:hypothetical protein
MKTLPLVKTFGGDGLGPADAVVLTQVKRTMFDAPHPAAIYERTKKRDGRKEGFEVFKIGVVKAGTPKPAHHGGGVVEESYETYPGANAFGFKAWHIWSLNAAEEKFECLSRGVKTNEETLENEDVETPTDEPATVVKTPKIKTPKGQIVLKWPEGEFTHTIVTKFNGYEKNQSIWTEWDQARKDGVIILARQKGLTKFWKLA